MKQTGEPTARLLTGLLRYPPQFHLHALAVSVHSPCLLVSGCSDVTPFPPAALPAFSGTTVSSDSLAPVCLPPFLIGCQAYSRFLQEAPGSPGLPRLRHIQHAMLLDPGEAGSARHDADTMLISAITKASSFPLKISGLNHFSLTAYGLPSRCPTLKRRSYPRRSKDSLPGGWLTLPGRASHPLEIRDLARPHCEAS